MSNKANELILQGILDTLATEVHNLLPGDIGSVDRVLVPISKAQAAITKHINDVILQTKINLIYDLVWHHSIADHAEEGLLDRASKWEDILYPQETKE